MKVHVFKSVGFVLMSFLYLTGCDSQPQTIDAAPLWSEQDVRSIEETHESLPGIRLSRQVTVFMEPPFYSGSMPLEFVSIKKELPGMSGISYTLAHIYDDWQNTFIYKSKSHVGLPDGAIAVNLETHRIMAECRFVKFLKNESGTSEMEIEEIHYDKNGEYPIFTSTFTVDFGRGFKKDERNVRGQKIQDYFFIWPTGYGSGY